MTTKWQRALYTPNLPLGDNGERVTNSIAHRELSKKAAKEGMVLLKNEHSLLPLQNGCKIAMFGKAIADYVKGGGGSGDVTVEYTVSLSEGMRRQQDYVNLYTPLNDFYECNVQEQYARGVLPGFAVEPEVPEYLIQGARQFTDTAIIGISRFSGEGWDRKSSYDLNRKEQDSYEEGLVRMAAAVFEDGDFYLSHAEAKMIETVKKHFAKIVVVLNVGGIVDTCWFKDEPAIGSVLLAWQAGMEGGLAAAELICGMGNPSGRLNDTFAKKLEDYPSSKTFHESDAYVDYSEDIYVGYRYFETQKDMKNRVNYPFGYGLSYTTFDLKLVKTSGFDTDKFQFTVRVTNTGKAEGKEVVQLYLEAPQGVLGKPSLSLVGFAKTRILAPGTHQDVEITVNFEQLASFDDLGKIQKSAYVIEKGEYRFFFGTNVENVALVPESYVEKQDRVLRQLTSLLKPHQLKERLLADGSYEALEADAWESRDEEVVPCEDSITYEGFLPDVRARKGHVLWKSPFKPGVHTFYEVAEGKVTLQEFVDQLSDEELAHLLGGQPNTGVAITCGFGNMPEYGIPNIMTADGPAGVRILPECGVNTTAFPCATLLACTWNPLMVYDAGAAGAAEMKENNLFVWLTPAINIHRSPLCGRNFEYYSEDPYLTGIMASAMVNGIQSKGVSACVKHFACNNKETNRKKSDSRVSERALREIYLKAFEIIVKRAKPLCIMTSYNIINGQRSSESHELITDILRGEWGYEGMVTTDWWTLGEHYKETMAGNDMKMACGFPENVIAALKDGRLNREDAKACVTRILEFILKMQ